MRVTINFISKTKKIFNLFLACRAVTWRWYFFNTKIIQFIYTKWDRHLLGITYTNNIMQLELKLSLEKGFFHQNLKKCKYRCELDRRTVLPAVGVGSCERGCCNLLDKGRYIVLLCSEKERLQIVCLQLTLQVNIFSAFPLELMFKIWLLIQ